MKLFFYAIPILLGAFAVLQGGINKKVSAVFNLHLAAVINASVLLVVALLALVVMQRDSFQQLDFSKFSWWMFIPGLLGYSLVFGIPWSVDKSGAVLTFVLLISSQLLMSIIWDLCVEQKTLSMTRILGVGIVWLGVIIASISER